MKMKRTIITAAMSAICICSTAQSNSIAEIMESIEQNNPALNTLRKQTDAQKIENKTGIYLSNPEVEYAYLWGDPSSVGKRHNINVTQTFDFATISGMKNRMADKNNELADISFLSGRQTILLEAQKLCLDVIYCNAMMQELGERLKRSQILAETGKKRLEEGDASMIEYNKVMLNLATVKGEMTRMETEKASAMENLKRLNGGKPVELTDVSYGAEQILPENFDTWYAETESRNPSIQYAKQQIEIKKYGVKLSKAMGLPSLSAGYTSELTKDVSYRGIAVGLSIPLWENKKKVKLAQAGVVAAEAQNEENKNTLYSQMLELYNRAKGLRSTADIYKQTLKDSNSTLLLQKALDEGQISLLDYILEVELYYNAKDQALSAERDYRKTLAELFAAEL